MDISVTDWSEIAVSLMREAGLSRAAAQGYIDRHTHSVPWKSWGIEGYGPCFGWLIVRRPGPSHDEWQALLLYYQGDREHGEVFFSGNWRLTEDEAAADISLLRDLYFKEWPDIREAHLHPEIAEVEDGNEGS